MYYGVIGNRDYIKYRGQRRPYWEFLDEQPQGWLTSLAYHRQDLPEQTHMIFDCGAWSYRAEETPRLGKQIVTPSWAYEQYQTTARPGDMLVAPDHMLIEKYGDMDGRRHYNRASAQEFLALCAERYKPMAVVHGLTLDERLEYARELYDLGYGALALGGLAGRASAKTDNINIVNTIRAALPDVWLHILGLSSPDYAGAWRLAQVESFDGSSHFKQAFTAGTFYTEELGQLHKHTAARTDRETGKIMEPITAPLCNCRACALLREDEVDTRTYGSNENNMGRAAHNQNMLMRAHHWHTRPTFILVACAKQKLSQPDVAARLYVSPWFRRASAFAATMGEDWYVLSAKYGLVGKQEIIEPYEQTLHNESRDWQRAWAQKVMFQVKQSILPEAHIVMLAGQVYRRDLTPLLEADGYAVTVPMKGLGIGQQLQWLIERTQQESVQKTLWEGEL